MIKAHFQSKEIFTALANTLPKANITSPSKVQYYCLKCNQQFAAFWNLRANAFNPWYSRGNYVHCAYCGAFHGMYILYAQTEDFVPFKIELKVNVFKQKLIFSVDYEALSLGEQVFAGNYQRGKEAFTFNLQSRKSYYSKKVFTSSSDMHQFSHTLINEKTAGSILNNSVLKHLHYDSLIYKSEDLRNTIKILFKEMKKLVSKANAKTNGLYVNTKGLNDGLFLRSLLNYAFKLADENKCCHRDAKYESKDNIQWLNSFSLERKQINAIYNLMEQENIDIITATIKVMQLPAKPIIRKMLANQSDPKKLYDSFQACKNFDCAIRLHNLREQDRRYAKYLLDFCKTFIPLYSEQAVISYLEKSTDNTSQNYDILRMFESASRRVKKRIVKEKVRISSLHDFLVIATQTEDEKKKFKKLKNLKLYAPEHILKRFAMQMNNNSFGLPKTALELNKLGREMKNCVHSYADRINNEICVIVYMADELGRFVACISIEGNSITEAKLKHNKAVKESAEVNRAILAWAKECELTICTQDILENQNVEQIQQSYLQLVS